MRDERMSLSLPVSTQKSQELEIHNEKNCKESHKKESLTRRWMVWQGLILE
jgi:hypothetical protein